MEIALQLRTPDQKEKLDKFPEHLVTFYDGIPLTEEEWDKQYQSFNRIYVGDEFCSNRLPLLTELKVFCQFAEEKQLNITLLTPVLTDEGLEKISPLFEYLKERLPETEVVVNDLGVLFFLKQKYPLFRLAVGRLLNKGFKDPRLLEANMLSSKEADELLNDSTFDHMLFQEKMMELEVTRLERDLLPYGDCLTSGASGLRTSIYFPFGYLTTGRVCWPASFNQTARESFMPVNRCSRSCNALTLELRNKSFSFQLIQSGNTIFYLYTSSMLSSLIKKAKEQNLRLVYQGFVLGGMT